MKLALVLAVATARVATAATFHAVPPVAVLTAPVNGTQAGSVSLANDTDAAITVDKLVLDNTCDPAITVPLTGFTVPAHGSQPVMLACGAHPAGMARCMVHARDATSALLADFEVACVYASTTTLAASTGAIAFPDPVTVGGVAAQTITVTNHGTAAETVGKLFFQLSDLDGNFTIGAPCNPDARDCTAGVAGVPVGGSTAVAIECTPHAPGLHTATLDIATDAGQHLASPIALSCTGATDPANPVILVGPSPVALGSVEVLGGLGTSSVTVQNVGGGAGTLAISDVRILDAGNGAALDWTFAASGKCTSAPCKLAPGDQLRLAIAFDPSALGVRDATLLVSYTDTVARTASIPLRGMGLGATLQLIGGSSIDFGTLPIGVAQAVAFQLVNTGNRTVTDVTLAGDGGAFALSPSTVTLAHATPVTITATCQPLTLGPTTTTFTASAPDVLAGTPIAITATCKGGGMALYASPSTLQLGELRIGEVVPDRTIQLLGTGATIDAAHLALPSPNLVLVPPALPAATPLALQLQVTAAMEGPLDPLASIAVTPGAGEALAIPISGSVVTASYAVPPVAALGTYCIGQPTTASTVALTSTGTATIALDAPTLQGGNGSPFELAMIAPTLYPDLLRPLGSAAIAITPDRQTVAGTQMDTLVWTTDVAGLTTATTKVTAAFADSGGAIAPAALGFGKVSIHTMTPGQRVTIQNCNTTDSLRLDAPHVPLPFSLDRPGDFPRTLAPNETISISVSFSPLVRRLYADAMTITSDTLASPLMVQLTGEGTTDPVDVDAGTEPPKSDGGGCCHAGSSTGGLTAALVLLLVLRRRR